MMTCAVLRELRLLLEQYCADRDEELDCAMFHSPLELIRSMERGAGFDILFLDVLMPGVNGIDTASEIRAFDKAVKIIFLTSSAEFAVQSYAVGAYFYQLKPIWKESFFRLMDSVLAACEKEHLDSIVLRCKTGVARIGLKELEYCESHPPDAVFPPDLRQGAGEHRKSGRFERPAGAIPVLPAAPPLLSGQSGICPEYLRSGGHHVLSDRDPAPTGEV